MKSLITIFIFVASFEVSYAQMFGMGLGLSLSYDIVRAHGGEIEIGNKGGRWSEVYHCSSCVLSHM